MLEMEMTDPRKLLIEARKMLDHFLGDDSCMCQACLLCRSIDAALSEKVEPVPVEPECVKYLAQYEQADEDGIIVKVSRQAIHETLAHIDSLQSALQRAQEDARDSALESLGYLRDKEKAEERNRRMVELMKEPSAPMKNMARGLLNLSTVKTEADATMLFKAMSAELLKEMEK